MAITKIPSIDYTTRDFLSTIDEFIRAIPFFTEEWTDHNPTDFGIVLAEELAYATDVMHYYIDRRGAEGFLPTAATRPSIVNLLKLINYEIPGLSAATVDVTFTLDSPLTGDLIIPSATQLQSTVSEDTDGEPILFETTEDILIESGELEGTVGAREGSTVSEDMDESEGTSFQKRTISELRILESSIKVYINEIGTEEEWTQIESLVFATASDKVYELSRNENDYYTIEFGDNAQGKIPITGASIRCVYVVGGGIRGNVGANTITQLVSTILFNNNPVSISVTNLLQASGGEEEQSIEEAKRVGPLSLKTFDRAITVEDIQSLALQIPGVAKAKAIASEPRVLRNTDLYIVPGGGGTVSQALIDDIIDFFEDRKMVGHDIIPIGAKYVSVDISGTVYHKPNYDTPVVRENVTNALLDFFDLDNENTDFGTGARISDIYRLIDETDGVEYVDLDVAALNPLSTVTVQVQSGDAEITEINRGTNPRDESFVVLFINNTQFNITGSVSGLQSNTGNVGSQFYSDDDQFDLLIENTGTPAQQGDIFTFRTSKLVGNSNLLNTEIRQQGNINLLFEVYRS